MYLFQSFKPPKITENQTCQVVYDFLQNELHEVNVSKRNSGAQFVKSTTRSHMFKGKLKQSTSLKM